MSAEIKVESASIERHEDFEVSVGFALAAPRHGLPGSGAQEYVISLHAECLGAHPNRVLGTRQGTLAADSHGSDTIISVAAGTLPPGSYRLASTLVVKGSPIAGYAEGPIIEVR